MKPSGANEKKKKRRQGQGHGQGFTHHSTAGKLLLVAGLWYSLSQRDVHNEQLSRLVVLTAQAKAAKTALSTLHGQVHEHAAAPGKVNNSTSSVTATAPLAPSPSTSGRSSTDVPDSQHSAPLVSDAIAAAALPVAVPVCALAVPVPVPVLCLSP